MIHQLFIISSVILSAYCQYPGSLTTTPAPAPPAQVHYVNIGADLAGDYKFGYDTGAGPKGQSFREETRSTDGTVRGAYGYTDANGQQRIVKYSAGKEGFKIEDDSPASSGGAQQAPRPAPTPAPYRPPPQTYQPQTQYRPSQSQSPQSQPPQTYRAPPSAPQSNYLELNARPLQTSYRPPSQTLRQVLPSSYSSPALSNLGSYSSSSLSSGSGASLPYPSSQPSYQSYPPSQPTLQTYRAPAGQPTYQQYRPSPQSAPAQSAQPILRQYSPLATTPRPEEETWGPPVINTALLSYNIGSQGGQPASRLALSSSSSSESYETPPHRSPAPINVPSMSTFNTPVLRTYTGLNAGAKPTEPVTWGPAVINTALLNYNIGSQRG